MNSSSAHNKPSPTAASVASSGVVGEGSAAGAASDDATATTQLSQATSTHEQQVRVKKKKKEDSVAAIPLAFPAVATESEIAGDTADDPTPHLAALKDDHSNVNLVAKACLHISQFAHHGSQAFTVQQDNLTSGVVLHDATFAKICSNCIASLTECLSEHKDRRCRILAAKALAVLGKAAYARIRPSPLLYTVRDVTVVSRLEDEIGAELPTALITAALEEEDEGVSAACLDACGTLFVFHSGVPGVLYGEDALTRELLSLTAPRVSPYAPTLSACVDEDPATAASELAARILENVLEPRLLLVVERVLRYVTTPALALAVPVITTAVVHQLQTTPSRLFGMDAVTFAKQWAEVDALGSLVNNTVLPGLIVPLLQQTLDGHLAQTAALAALRLAHAVSTHATAHGQVTWITDVCRDVVTVQQEALTATPLSVQSKMNLVACLLIAARPLPFPERTSVLLGLVDTILALPSTTRVPLGVGACPGLVLHEFVNRHYASTSRTAAGVELQHKQAHYGTHYRRPARLLFWTELALHFFLDGPAPTAMDVQIASAAGTENKTTTTSGSGRQEALRKFLSLPAITAVIGEGKAAASGAAAAAPLTPQDELLLAFTSVAIACGRRFRGGAVDPTASHAASSNNNNSAWPITDPSAQPVEEWLQLSWVVLTAFVPCVNGKKEKKYTYLEEDLSLGMAGLTQYVQLLQEYLHFAGLLHPGSSVALKLVANACPPHLLWDQLSESAAFLARFEALDMGLLDNTTKLLEDIVLREVKQGGIPSHHMRLFLLALASDHWMQGRVAAIRKQLEGSSAGNATPNLDVPSAREIILALSPKRILGKIFAAHVPPTESDGKKKKDPIKRLASETVRVCVACIENIALIACDWRKRFHNTGGGGGSSSQEPKHVVSVAVGVLQGKVESSSHDAASAASAHADMIQTIMAPVCDAAVSRIQSFYESDMGGQDSFPASELVMQNVKTKIKPLVSSSSRPPTDVTKDEYAHGYLMQLCRQLVQSRIDVALHSLPPADAELTPARAVNWLRLAVPPIPDARDGRARRGNSSSGAPQAQVVTAGSDPTCMVLAYTPRRYLRHDGEHEYRIAALLRVYNTTNIEFTEGLRLEMGLVNQTDHEQAQLWNGLQQRENGDYGGGTVDYDQPDELEHAVRQALGLGGPEDNESLVAPMASASVLCKQELKPGEFLSWEVTLDPHGSSGVGQGLSLLPSVVFRHVNKEPPEVGASWVGEKSATGDASTINTGDQSGSGGGEDDFQQVHTETTHMSGVQKDAEAPSENIALAGTAVRLPPMLPLQPCPLVFLRDCWGDMDAFRFLWFRMPHHLPEVPLLKEHDEDDDDDEWLQRRNASPATDWNMKRLADLSCLVWNGEAIPGGYVTKAWAFGTLSGRRVLAVLSELDADSKKMALFLRGDDPYVLYGLMGPPRNRLAVAAALAPTLTPVFY